MGVNSDKTSTVFFVLIFAVFLPDFIFLYHDGTESPTFVKIMHVFDLYTPHETRMFTMRLAGNGRYQGNGFAVAVLAFAMLLDHPHFVATVLQNLLGAQKA